MLAVRSQKRKRRVEVSGAGLETAAMTPWEGQHFGTANACISQERPFVRSVSTGNFGPIRLRRPQYDDRRGRSRSSGQAPAARPGQSRRLRTKERHRAGAGQRPFDDHTARASIKMSWPDLILPSASIISGTSGRKACSRFDGALSTMTPKDRAPTRFCAGKFLSIVMKQSNTPSIRASNAPLATPA
jgi:hypothetical protein